MTPGARAIAFLSLLVSGFCLFVWAVEWPAPPPWRGGAVLFASAALFRIMNRFEQPRG